MQNGGPWVKALAALQKSPFLSSGVALPAGLPLKAMFPPPTADPTEELRDEFGENNFLESFF